MRLAFAALVVGCGAFDPAMGGLSAPVDSGAPVLFGRDIRPLMDRAAGDPAGSGCKACHYATQQAHHGTDVSGLDLSSLGSLRRGGNDTRQNVVIPNNPAGSAIVQKLRGTFAIGLRMPRNGPTYWSEADIERVERWIAQGAKGDDTE